MSSNIESLSELEASAIQAFTSSSHSSLTGSGLWIAELIWYDAEEERNYHRITGHDIGTDNVYLDLLAALSAIKMAKELRRPIQVRSAVESNVMTASSYLRSWKQNGWKRKKGKIKNLAEWKEIDSLSQQVAVTWYKRKKGERGATNFDEAQW